MRTDTSREIFWVDYLKASSLTYVDVLHSTAIMVRASRNNLPLAGIKVVEFAGLAPGPMAGMILADFGADVVRIDRPTASAVPTTDILGRGKRSIAINPKTRSGYAVVRELVERADVLIDPFRPGVMERLKLGPEVFLGNPATKSKGVNEKLVYARLVGFPRTGPHKDMAGHDLNYLAISGVLSMFPGEGKPEFPLNLLADFAGGALMCVVGILLALFERTRSGVGQVVDTDMVTGVRYLASYPLLLSQLQLPTFGETRAGGLLDGGCPFYNVYTCADGRWVSVACLEPQFFRTFLTRFLGALPKNFSIGGWRPSEADQQDRDIWPRLKTFLERGFSLQPRDYWTNVFHGTDACVLPVLERSEAAAIASTPSRNAVVPPPHPGLSRTPSVLSPSPTSSNWAESSYLPPGAHTQRILSELGLSSDDMAALREEGALGKPPVAKL
ncbi:CoA-transferase family III [Dichomitus squalens]|uniref:CoA-transferase family III n=1 Tax=Dichomitus squalens TaxID=114155 RepID=A0A4V2K1E3_9APHY|nr:CoA-transferase family III [Dichomitus squalens]